MKMLIIWVVTLCSRADILKGHAASISSAEDGSHRFLRNVFNYPVDLNVNFNYLDVKA
jgi:hypothetical protein